MFHEQNESILKSRIDEFPSRSRRLVCTPNFTEFVVVNAHGVFSAHVTHLDAKPVEL